MNSTMKRKEAERIIRENGPCTPEEVHELYKPLIYANPSVDKWENAMQASPRLTEDDSGRFHLSNSG